MGVDPQYALVSGLSVEDTVKGNSSYVTPLGVVVPPESLMKISGENPVEYGLGTEITIPETTCSEHLWYKIDTVIYTGGTIANECAKQIWGIAKGDPANMLYGGGRGTHINLGVSCTTGVSGNNYHYCTVSGGYGNLAGYEGATVAGGQFNKVRGDNGFIGAGDSNRIEDASYSAIAGGYLNRIFATGDSCEGTRSLSLEDLERDTTLGEGTIEGLRALYGGGEKYGYDFIGAGSENKICTGYNGIVASSSNEISGYAGFIGSGMKNRVESAYGFIGAGYGNYASSSYASVVGGSSNSATGVSAVICNGDQNKASSNYTFVGSGRMNEASGFASFVGGGFANKNLASYSFVGGGMSDSIKSLSLYGFIGAGRQNTVDGAASSIVGGGNNYVDGDYSVIGGGDSDTIKGPYSGIFSGYKNKAGDSSDDTAVVILGGKDNKVTVKYGVVGGGKENSATDSFSVVVGGYSNLADGSIGCLDGHHGFAFVGGGRRNQATGYGCVVVGGDTNIASGDNFLWYDYTDSSRNGLAFVGGGKRNEALGYESTVCGGFANKAKAWGSFIGGGSGNEIDFIPRERAGDFSVICGGVGNYINNQYSGILAGADDTITSICSIAMGRQVKIDPPTGYSFAFGRDINVTTDYTAVFFGSSFPGKFGINTDSPNSNFQCEGSFALPIAQKNTDYTVGDDDYTIVALISGIVITLPSPSGIKGRIYVIKNFSGGNITVKSPPGTYIDNASGVAGFILGAWKSIMVQSNGTDRWYIIAHRDY